MYENQELFVPPEESEELFNIRQRYLIKLQSLQEREDIHRSHMAADDILCQLLIELGYSDVVIEYVKIDKWYP